MLQRLLTVSFMVALLAACASPTSTPASTAVPQPTTEVIASSTAVPQATAAVTASPSAVPAAAVAPIAVEYNLGETTIVQSNFPEESRFRHMPVRLNGVISVPTAGEGPFPVVMILHGTHPGCPEIDHVDRWPCDPEVERPNYRGFAYLTEQLAAKGYVALSININAENTFGFGEPMPNERLKQIVDMQLQALATAAAGGENKFGVDLQGKADMHRLALIGHSRGGEKALLLARDSQQAGANTASYGPIAGVLQIAPSPVFVDPAYGSPVPLALIIPLCDGDVINQDGQVFYEATRLAPGQQAWATSVFLEHANHNFFNSTLGDDPFALVGRPDCDSRLDGQAQQEFLSDYAGDFLATLFGSAAAAKDAKSRLAIDPSVPAPSELYGLAARVAVLPPAAERTVLFTPKDDSELNTNLLGGAVQATGTTLFFCEAGYFTPFMRPGTEPCRRVNVNIPGNPALAVVSWEKPGASLRFAIPQGKGDFSRAAAISLRAAVDPLSKFNAAGQEQAFTVQVTDGTGKTSAVHTRSAEPALQFPLGQTEDEPVFTGDLFTGRVPLTTVRFPLSAFTGVDVGDIREIAVMFDQTPSGSLFMGDVEVVQAQP